MAERLSLQFRRLLEERKLQRIEPKHDIITKETASAEYDLGKSKNSFEEADYKWAIVQAYYSMFHAARALIYSKGYREKSHRACLVALKEFFLDALGEEQIDDFEEAMDLRESADYGSAYTDEDARNLFAKAQEFLE
ncbi:MAG TPA: HEPN domain-containing protein, partial [Candidatus Hodarchaeales archaeon]|nr:HEPN domain-containing protein [Candidatus Hodarchaeales archaeon]